MSEPDISAPARKLSPALIRLRNRSKRLYGNADRLQVAYAVAKSPGVVHAQELADALLISPPRVRAQLLAFVEAEVMLTLPRSGHIQNYERLDDAFWPSTVAQVEAFMPNAGRALALRSRR
jgi:hypothetical protein